MPPTRVWELQESLTEVTLHGDWDPVTSLLLSLRIHLFEYGTVPVWNTMLCGGRPELAVPSSWAYTWPSLFAYLLAPNYAVIAVWLVMTLTGFLATRALLLRWSGSSLGAAVGACVYALSGYFATRFNAGHVSFAFYHLVPLLMIQFENAFDHGLDRRRVFGWCAAFAGTAFLFASAGLPHPVLHFLPALLLLIGCRVLVEARRCGLAPVLRAATAPALAGVLGGLVAAYKVWPVIRWQLDHPRKGVRFESYTLGNVLDNSLTLVRDYFDPTQKPAWQEYSAWGYNAFVGPVPWLLAGFALLAVATTFASRAGWLGRVATAAKGVRRDATLFAGLSIAAGILLALGNDNPLSPAHVFRGLPILKGIRAFNRYQILFVFGLAVLVAQALAILSALIPKRALRATLLGVLAFAAVAPVLVQTGYLVWNIHAEPNASIFERYAFEARESVPALAWKTVPRLRKASDQTSLLERGYWIANCYRNITLPGAWPERAEGRTGPLSFPPPERIGRIGRSEIELRYADAPGDDITWNLRFLPGFQLDAPFDASGEHPVVRRRDPSQHSLTLTADYPGPRAGAVTSAAALVATFLYLFLIRRAERGAAHSP